MGKRLVLFLSDSTGITAETLGHSLLTQFSDTEFDIRIMRYIRDRHKAEQTARLIDAEARRCGEKIIVFSTLVDPELRSIVSDTNSLFLDFMNVFVPQLESELGAKASPVVGHSHGVIRQESYAQRMEAVNFALQNDDGGSVRHYDHADVILTGVSRCGKTPTSVYLALHYGIFVANYPLVEEDLDADELPPALKPYKAKLFGLSIRPERLQMIRQERQPGSRYADLRQCQYEIRQVEGLFRRHAIPFLDISSMSVEEIATSILHQLGGNHQPR